jgi:glycerol-3-phosphate acyltransferase PlsX
MGTDNAPLSEVRGAAEALKEIEGIRLVLVGDENKINAELKKIDYDKNRLSIHHCTQVIDMHESPADAIKKKPDSSIVQGLKLQKEKKADAFISAGNTGAVMASSLFILGRISNISRPTIGSVFPTDEGLTIVFDVGANVDSKPIHLLEFAVMGIIYANHVFKSNDPKVALLNIGEEKTKGDSLSVSAYELLEKSGLNFMGNVEGRDILRGKAEVIVCDGFVGNVVLKFTESVMDVLKNKFKKYSEEHFMQKVWIALMYRTLKKILKDFDYQEYGGVPLLGVKGIAIIGHGRSSPKAIKTMISKAELMVRAKINELIAEKVKDIKQHIPQNLIYTT